MELGSLVAVTRHGATCGHHTAYIRKITDSEIPFTGKLRVTPSKSYTRCMNSVLVLSVERNAFLSFIDVELLPLLSTWSRLALVSNDRVQLNLAWLCGRVE